MEDAAQIAMRGHTLNDGRKILETLAGLSDEQKGEMRLSRAWEAWHVHQSGFQGSAIKAGHDLVNAVLSFGNTEEMERVAAAIERVAFFKTHPLHGDLQRLHAVSSNGQSLEI